MKAELIDGSFKPEQHEAVVFVELDGEAVLYHEMATTVHVLSPTATIIWRFLDGVQDLDGLSRDLSDVFSVGFAQIRDDVVEAARTFGRQGLLKGVEPDDATVADSVLEQVERRRLER